MFQGPESPVGSLNKYSLSTNLGMDFVLSTRSKTDGIWGKFAFWWREADHKEVNKQQGQVTDFGRRNLGYHLNVSTSLFVSFF